MLLEPLALASCFGAPLVLGAAALRALGIVPRTDRLAYLGWAWMLGALGTAGVVFVWLWSGLDVAHWGVPSAAVLLLATGLAWSGRRRPALPAAPLPAPRSAASALETWLFRAVLAFVLAVTLERILSGSLVAVVRSDEAIFWSFRAKLLFHEGGFGPRYGLALREVELNNPDYPLLNSLLETWVFAHAGRITHVWNRVPIQLFSLALVLVLAAGLRRATRPALAAGLLLLLPALAEAAHGAASAYSDVLVALGVLVLLDAWLRGAQDPRPGWAGLGSLALAFLLWSKHDGVLALGGILVAGALAALVAPRGGRAPASVRARAVLLWLSPAALVLVLGWAVNLHFAVSNAMMTRGTGTGVEARDQAGNFLTVLVAELPARLGPILTFFRDEVFLAAREGQFLVPVFALLIALSARGLPRRFALAAVALAVSLSGMVLVFFGLPWDLEWHLETAAARLVFQDLPAVLLWIGATSAAWTGLRRPLLSALLGAFLLWRGLAVAPSLARELGPGAVDALRASVARSEPERIEAGLGLLDEEHGRDEVELWRALVTLVPERSRVFAFFGTERAWMAKPLPALLYPLRFVRVPPPPRPFTADEVRAFVGDGWVLDLVGAERSLVGTFQRLASGEGWSLWR